VRYYCQNCWQDFWENDFTVCPKCGFDTINLDKQDFTDKLINALNHRAGEIRHLAVTILAERKEKRAVSSLERIAKGRDPSLAKAAREAIRKITEGS